ncbi:hypothetical protein PTKIN_Ptkin07bG0049500 [Pterospermum kingtungense]
MDMERGESSTEEAEVEWPRSVVVQMKKKVERVHSQVLRIREEESQIGEEFVGNVKEINNSDVVCGGVSHEKRRRPRRVNFVIVSRPILPCSPLSGKNSLKRPCTEAT